MAKLIIFDSDGRRETPLKDHNRIGRLPPPLNDVQILDKIVSKEHAVIAFDSAKGFIFQDLGSLNGSYVNRQKVLEEVVLRDGDEISFGNARGMFLSEEAAAKALEVVDMSEGALQSHIHSKITALENRFLPEKEITGEKHLRADYEKLRVTYELQREVSLDLDLDQMLQKILASTFMFLNCDRGVILLTDNKGELKPRAFKMKKPEDKLVISSTLVSQVQKEKAGILSSDAQMDNRFKEAESMIMRGIRSSMAVPILHQDELLGCILIDSSVAVNAYSEKDLHLLSNIGNQTGLFLKNVSMAKKIETDAIARERFSKLEHELSMASEIQKSMLPSSIPSLKGYEFSATMRPAKTVGGDFFDFIPLGENLLGIAVGDVSGKGIPAALFMAMVRSLLRAEAHPGRSIQKVLRSVNHHLMDMNDNGMFVTILFGVLNAITRQFQYVRAGHEIPILSDGHASFKRLPKGKGQALGVFEEIVLDEQSVELSKGRMLLLSSDGITDAHNQQNINFGYDGIVGTVGQMVNPSASLVCDELIKAVNKHQAGSLQYDDMTIVVIQAI